MQTLDNSREKILWASIIPQMIIMTISTLWVYFSKSNEISNYLQFNFTLFFQGILAGIVLAFAGYLFYRFAKKTKIFYETVELFEERLAPVFKNLKPRDIMILSLVSGFSEEVLFRGLVLPTFGIVIASISFGLLHLPGFKYWIYALWATLSGFLLGFLLILSGSLWLPITTHVTNNIIGMIMLRKLPASGGKN